MSDTHIYRTIYEHLLSNITKGKYSVGMRLPTEKELCEQFSVSRITAKRALDMLASDGIVKRTKGKGTFVIDRSAGWKNALGTRLKGTQIGVIMPSFSDSFGTRMLCGIEKECAQRGCYFVLRLSWGDLERERRIIDELKNLGVAGLVIFPVSGTCYNLNLLNLILNEFPVVIMDRHMPGLDTCFVGTDNVTSTKCAMNHLFELKHENIAWVSPPSVQTSTLEERQNALLESFIEHNCLPHKDLWYQNILSVFPGNDIPEKIEQDIENLREHFRAHPEITAVFASEYNVAWLVKMAAKSIGIRIPQDLSIVCFDAPSQFSKYDEFSHIQQDEDSIGRNAVRLLMERLADSAGAPGSESVIFPGTFVIGRSTARARTAE